jgi:hypothetical protein
LSDLSFGCGLCHEPTTLAPIVRVPNYVTAGRSESG